MGRNHLIGRAGDAINALMAAVGDNFRLLVHGSPLRCAPCKRSLKIEEPKRAEIGA